MGPSGCMGSGLGGRDLGRDAYFARVFASYSRYRVPPCVGFPRASRMAYSDRIGWSLVRVDTN